MHFAQFIAPSILLAGSAAASNVKRSAYGYGYDDTSAEAAGDSYSYSDKSSDDYAADAVAAEEDDGDDYYYKMSSEWEAATADAAGAEKDYDYETSSKWASATVDAVAAATSEAYGGDYATGDMYGDDYVKPEADAVDADKDCDDDDGDDDDVEGEKMVQVVQVSNADGDLVFSPNDIKAPVGSHVQFQFWPKNHSIVQSDFANPCVPINDISPDITGVFSGFMPVSPDDTETPVFTVEVTDEKPIWFYCSQGQHCQSGMGGVINAPADGEKTIEMYIAAAADASDNISPAHDVSGGVGNSTADGSDSAYGDDDYDNDDYGDDYSSDKWSSTRTPAATADSSVPSADSTLDLDSSPIAVPTESANGTATEDLPAVSTGGAAGSLAKSAMGSFAGVAMAAVVAVVAL